MHVAPDYPIGIAPERTSDFIDQLEAQWGKGVAWRSFIFHLPEDEATRRLIARYERQSTTPGVMKQILLSNVAIDVREVLPSVHASTLVLHRSGDPLIAPPLARYMAERIQGARFVELPGDFHLSAEVGREDDAMEAISSFVAGAPAERVASYDRVLATVLFTDIVDSTAKAASLGDRAWTELLERHDEIAEREIVRHRGHLVKRTGDGLLATFDGPARCVSAAHAIRNATRLLGLEVRAGLHTGEIERRAADVSGIAVHIGARIASLAAPGEILVSNTVKDLVIGSGIVFADRGCHSLKGIPGEWQVWAAAE